MQEVRPDTQPRALGQSDERVAWALKELEEITKGSEQEPNARAALDVLRRAFTSVRAYAATDPLTGLANRACFDQLLDERLIASDGGSTTAAVLFLDLDGFKSVNDERGHAAGDVLLADVARRIARSVREQDVVARHGGDEFVVLLEKLESQSVAHAVAARVIEAVSAPFMHGDGIVQLGVSIGVAFYPDHGRSSTELLQNADDAMYRAKGQGGRSYAVFGERSDLAQPRPGHRSWTWELTLQASDLQEPVELLGQKR